MVQEETIPPLNIYIAPTVCPGMMCNLNLALNATVFSLLACKLDFRAADGYKSENNKRRRRSKNIFTWKIDVLEAEEECIY